MDSLIKRQNKIIVSVTSYPKRFPFLPILMTAIKSQIFNINKIMIFLHKDDYKHYNLKLKDVDIIPVEKDLRPHNKYFYAMKLYRDYAIITLDDDANYQNDTFKFLFDAYIKNPNIVSGKRSHVITYKNNGEAKVYNSWMKEQKKKTEIDFDIFLTGCSGIIYPPDILNIDDSYIPIIEETKTCDDITLKYFEIKKGVPSKWIKNKNYLAPPIYVPNTQSNPLSTINGIFNNVCIDKLNLNIQKLNLNNLCIPYKNIQN